MRTAIKKKRELVKKRNTKIITAVAVVIAIAAITICINLPDKGGQPSNLSPLESALEIAGKSECVEKGDLTRDYFYNENTKTWWINLAMKEEFQVENCYPACVISEETATAEINWRCTGLIPE